ncbi:hypothetical protein [Spirosoma utsteinense]|uniref:Uncharacterized protein n=1 Tax=Spirosoma utsteinense TaxID=2585773 RepID=A0ABR6W0T3_9BACT|nr:hypothetical protein [Spirosoma utsteinense]MBC3790229.1 hypothetical protein [Spirosoma utsteinense]
MSISITAPYAAIPQNYLYRAPFRHENKVSKLAASGKIEAV